ncbi:hypothetical protein [Geoalkalibacter sp.]|uniref:hypothetical protein n=1 Tax=Geoalkalibacter sp. TaxID=3041440 RepID=UPI00272ED0AF|nr:hypothetical protein [Geoalkalibacter sp.]
MWYGFRKILGLSLLFFLILAVSTPLVTSAAAGGIKESACCAHESGGDDPDVADQGHDCPFCSVLSFDLTAPVTLCILVAESRTPSITPATAVPAQYPRNIDWPPEPA